MSMVLASTALNASPVQPGIWRTFTLENGQTIQVQLMGDEFLHFWEDKDGNRYSYDTSKGLKPANMPELRDRSRVLRQEACPENIVKKYLLSGGKGGFQTDVQRAAAYTGKKRCLILLAQFSDVKFTMSDPQAFYNRVANEKGFSEGKFKGSVADYFRDQSNGKFELEFDIAGPYTLGEQAYYGKNEGGQQDANVQAMITACCTQAASEGRDFSAYDWDGDGQVEMVFVVYAGRGEATGGGENTIWPHKGRLKSLKVNGKTIVDYACSNELSSSNEVDGIGTICHEFSHCLGYPDAYDTNYTGLYGMGTWDIMCQGNYNGASFTPAGYTAYEKMAAGWIEPIELKDKMSVTGMKPLADGGDAYIFRNPGNSNEYYLLENRQQKGWDAALNGSGIMVNHIDFNQTVWDYNAPNTVVSGINNHERITYIPADNSKDKDTEENDPWPYGNRKSLNNATTPATTVYSSNTDGSLFMNVMFSDMAIASDGTASFNFTDLNKAASQEETIFTETFDKCMGKGGNDDNGFVTKGAPNQFANGEFSADMPGWTANVDMLKGAFQCARVGKSSATDVVLTSPEIKLNGEATLTFSAAPFGKNDTQMTVSVEGGSIENGTFNLTQQQWNECKATIKGNGKIKLNFTSDSFFIDEVKVTEKTASGISQITTDGKLVKAYYNAQGLQSQTPFKGLNIIKYVDGTAKKVYIK